MIDAIRIWWCGDSRLAGRVAHAGKRNRVPERVERRRGRLSHWGLPAEWARRDHRRVRD